MLICLSGFVPNLSRTVRAGSATINAVGAFTEGITISPAPTAKAVQFGKLVATGSSGTLRILPSGGVSAVNGFVNGGLQQQARLLFQAGASKVINISVTGLQNTLPLGTVAGVASGIVNFSTVKVTGPFAGTKTFTIGSTKQSVALSSTTVDMGIGGAISWGPTRPIGTFNHTVTISVSF